MFSAVDCWRLYGNSRLCRVVALKKWGFSLADVQSGVLSLSCMHVTIDPQLSRWCFVITLVHVSMRRYFKSLVSRTGVLYTRFSCINPQFSSQPSLGVIFSVHTNFWSELCPLCWTPLLTSYKNSVISTLRHFRRCYLKANKVGKSERTMKVGWRHHFWKCVHALCQKRITDISPWLSKLQLVKFGAFLLRHSV